MWSGMLWCNFSAWTEGAPVSLHKGNGLGTIIQQSNSEWVIGFSTEKPKSTTIIRVTILRNTGKGNKHTHNETKEIHIDPVNWQLGCCLSQK